MPTTSAVADGQHLFAEDGVILWVVRIAGEDAVLVVGLFVVDGVALRDEGLSVDRKNGAGVPHGIAASVGGDVALARQRRREHRQLAQVDLRGGEANRRIVLAGGHGVGGDRDLVNERVRDRSAGVDRQVNEYRARLACDEAVGAIPAPCWLQTSAYCRGVEVADHPIGAVVDLHPIDNHRRAGEVRDG